LGSLFSLFFALSFIGSAIWDNLSACPPCLSSSLELLISPVLSRQDGSAGVLSSHPPALVTSPPAGARVEAVPPNELLSPPPPVGINQIPRSSLSFPFFYFVVLGGRDWLAGPIRLFCVRTPF